jgi:hypothetical protein
MNVKIAKKEREVIDGVATGRVVKNGFMLLTTDHPGSSYGQPVLVVKGIAYGSMDIVDHNDIFLRTAGQIVAQNLKRGHIFASEEECARVLTFAQRGGGHVVGIWRWEGQTNTIKSKDEEGNGGLKMTKQRLQDVYFLARGTKKLRIFSFERHGDFTIEIGCIGLLPVCIASNGGQSICYRHKDK